MTGDDADISSCLRQVLAHDQDAARALVDRLYPQVLRIIRSHLPARTAEEDLAQEIFLKMFARLNQYQPHPGIPFEHWVSRLAVRTCLDRLRAERRRPELRWTDLSEEQSRWLEFLVSDQAPQPEDAPGPVRDLLERFLAQLPPEDRLVIHLLDLEGKSVKDIAHLTQWSVTRVKVRAFRARAKLRKLAATFRKEHPHESL
jgi:RNA polymerase sigma-70 factor (ECF subfamily)